MAETSEEKALKKRLTDARAMRQQMKQHIDGFYDLGVPLRCRIGQTGARTHQKNLDEQDDIFDQTFQAAVEDFANAQQDFFCPDYRPWVNMVPGVALDTAAAEEGFEEAKEAYEEKLYGLIRQTDFYEQLSEVMIDLAGAAAGMVIPLQTDVRKPVRCMPVMMANLLFDEGAYHDLDGRWHEFSARRTDLPEMFPGIDLADRANQDIRIKPDHHQLKVVQGCHRNSDGGWEWRVWVDGKIRLAQTLDRDAPPPVIVARWRHNPPSPWGPGPSLLALPAGRVLDELGYRNLKRLGKEVDPPMSYEQDGIFNPEQEIVAGSWHARRQGSGVPTPMYEPSQSQNVYFERDKLQDAVRRAFYLDEVGPRGETPPTATELIMHEARQQRRQQARRRVYREFVLPALRRFAYVFSRRGELPPVQIDGKTIAVEFVNPLSKASDADEVANGINIAQAAMSMFPPAEGQPPIIDGRATVRNWIKKSGDTTVVLAGDEDDAAV